jgi:hypothetical protein
MVLEVRARPRHTLPPPTPHPAKPPAPCPGRAVARTARAPCPCGYTVSLIPRRPLQTRATCACSTTTPSRRTATEMAGQYGGKWVGGKSGSARAASCACPRMNELACAPGALVRCAPLTLDRGDACERCPTAFRSRSPQIDTDGDQIPDECVRVRLQACFSAEVANAGQGLHVGCMLLVLPSRPHVLRCLTNVLGLLPCCRACTGQLSPRGEPLAGGVRWGTVG